MNYCLIRDKVKYAINSIPDDIIKTNDIFSSIVKSSRSADYYLDKCELQDVEMDSYLYMIYQLIDIMLVEHFELSDNYLIDKIIKMKIAYHKDESDYYFVRQKTPEPQEFDVHWVISIILDVISEIREPYKFPNKCWYCLYFNYQNRIERITKELETNNNVFDN